MSIVVQKKKFSSSKLRSSPISQLPKNVQIDQRYSTLLANFESNFKKSCSQATLKSLKTVLDSFYRAVKTDEFFLTDLSKHGDAPSENIENVYLTLKTLDVVNLLADYITDRKSILVRNRRSFEVLDRMSSDTRDVTLLSLKILKLFSIINMYFAMALSHKPHFCTRMFELLLQDNKIYFKQVLGIQEALIASNPDIINNSIYPHMQEALSNMPRKYFARFSRIVALLVLENSEKMDFKDLPSDYIENKMIKVQSFLLAVPELIETYVIILEYLKEIMERLIFTTPQNARKSIRYLKESNLIKDSGLNLSFLKPLFDQAQISGSLAMEIFTPKFIVKFIVRKSNLTEILFVLSNLLLGKRKIEVQNKLRQINFVDRILHPLLDLLFHPDIDDNGLDDPFGDSSPCNNPLATTRIQLLRIIINFCDRDSANIANKELLLSSEEKHILSQLIQGALRVHCPDQFEPKKQFDFDSMSVERTDMLPEFFIEERLKTNAFASVQKKGLLNKIIKLFNRYDPNTNYRFWLASCVESFLRGFYEPHQIFVAHTGILYTLLEQIMNKKISKASNVQISFDLVGEIIKFNKYTMIFFEKACEKFQWTDKLAERTVVNVVDSNVFLRALLLSFERFEHNYNKKMDINGRQDGIVDFNASSNLYKRFAQDQVNWFNLIIESVDPNLISQDNICCINTILIMSMFLEQKGELQAYIDTIVKKKEKSSSKLKETLQNFSNVLIIWKKYYLSKTKDSFSLQYTSSLPFYYFQDMMHKLKSRLDDEISRL